MKTKRIAALCLAMLMLLSFGGCKRINLFKKTKKEPLSVSLSFVHYDDGLKANFVKHKDRFVKTLAPTYGMSTEQANDLIKNQNNYGVFFIDTTIANREETGYTFAKVEVSGEHDGIWFCRSSVNGQIGVPSKTTTDDFLISFVADTQKLDAAAIYKTLEALTFSVLYYDTPADDDEIIDESEYKTLTAHNLIASPDGGEDVSGLKVSFDSIEDGDDYAQLYRADEAGLALYGYADAVIDRFMAKDSKWDCYLLNIKVTNDTGEEIIFYGSAVSQNGKDGVWIAPKSLDGDEFGLSAGTETTVAFLLLVDPDVAGSATLTDSVKSMNIALRYTVERTDIDQIETCLRVPNTIEVGTKG